MSEQQQPKKPPEAPVKSKEAPPQATQQKHTDAEGNLLPHLQAVQAEHSQQPPPRVKLKVPPKDEMGQPVAEPPFAPPPSPGNPSPRFVHENERAPAGFARFKIRAVNMGVQDSRYVLAADETAARTYYVTAMGLDRVCQAMGDSAPEIMLSVKRLPD